MWDCGASVLPAPPPQHPEPGPERGWRVPRGLPGTSPLSPGLSPSRLSPCPVAPAAALQPPPPNTERSSWGSPGPSGVLRRVPSLPGAGLPGWRRRVHAHPSGKVGTQAALEPAGHQESKGKLRTGAASGWRCRWPRATVPRWNLCLALCRAGRRPHPCRHLYKAFPGATGYIALAGMPRDGGSPARSAAERRRWRRRPRPACMPLCSSCANKRHRQHRRNLSLGWWRWQEHRLCLASTAPAPAGESPLFAPQRRPAAGVAEPRLRVWAAVTRGQVPTVHRWQQPAVP